MAAGAPDGARDTASAPAALLRLREGDVVRLCGLNAAAHGLEYAARHAVWCPRREGARLLAQLPAKLDAPFSEGVSDQTPCDTWAELVETPFANPTPANRRGAHLALRWGCAVHASQPAQRLGCEHVAALLSAWLRVPGDFRVPPSASPQPSIPALPPLPAVPAAPVRQPLSPSREAREARFTLAGELERMTTRDVCDLAERLARVNTPPDGARQTPTDDDATTARMFVGATLTDARSLQRVIERLEPNARAAFTDLMLLGGTITSADVAALYERGGRRASDGQHDLLTLERFGLVFRALYPAGETSQHSPVTQLQQLAGWRIAPELRATATIDLPSGSRTADKETRQATHPDGRRSLASPRALCLALALLALAPAPLGLFGAMRDDHPRAPGTTEPAETTIKTRGASPLAPGDLPPAYLTRLAHAAGMAPGLARMARRILLWGREQAPGQPLTDLASAPPDERALVLRAGFALWRMIPSAADLLDLEDSETPEGGATRMRYDVRHPAFRPAALASETAAAREFVVGLLAHALPGVWYRLDELLTLIWRLHPLFLRSRQQTYSPPIWRLERVADGRPLRPNARDEWLAGEGVFIRALVAGPLHWWGALDLAYDAAQPRRLSHIRLSRFGAFLLASSPTPEATELATQELRDHWGEAMLTTRDGMLAVHPLAVIATQLDGLARWAQPVRIAGGRLLYALSDDLAAAAFDQGLQPDDATRMLGVSGHSGEALLARLRAWHARYGATSVLSGWALLEARDEPTLQEALAYVPGVASRARLLSPAQALLRHDDLATLRAALHRRGITL